MSPAKHTEIAYILDRSGSMQGMQKTAIASFNQFIKSQLEDPTPARLTLALFNSEYDVPYETVPLEKIPQLNTHTYVPRGQTALLDAVGRTIKDTDNYLSKLPEEERPNKVIIVIFTDGMENASKRYSRKKISELIQHYRTEKEWEFLFLAANQDAISSGRGLNINSHDSGNITFSNEGWLASGSAMSRKVRAMRKFAAKAPMAAHEEHDLKANMESLIKEEEQKPQQP